MKTVLIFEGIDARDNLTFWSHLNLKFAEPYSGRQEMKYYWCLIWMQGKTETFMKLGVVSF